MSIPNFPENITKINWEQALSMVVASIAMEELALSHILNAEGEKMQYVLGSLHKGQSCGATTNEILKVNESIGTILEKVETNQILLKGKLEQAIRANQRPAAKTSKYCSIADACWYKGQALTWLSAEFSEGASSQIPLPVEKCVLVSYSVSLELPARECSAFIVFKQQMGAKEEIIAGKEGHVQHEDGMVCLSGCMVISPENCEGGSLECVLSAPCCACISRATLTVTAL